MPFGCAARCFKQVELLRIISDSEKTDTAGCVKISNSLNVTLDNDFSSLR